MSGGYTGTSRPATGRIPAGGRARSPLDESSSRLYAYHARFPKAVEAYRGYLADPAGWRPA